MNPRLSCERVDAYPASICHGAECEPLYIQNLFGEFTRYTNQAIIANSHKFGAMNRDTSQLNTRKGRKICRLSWFRGFGYPNAWGDIGNKKLEEQLNSWVHSAVLRGPSKILRMLIASSGQALSREHKQDLMIGKRLLYVAFGLMTKRLILWL